MKSKLKKAMQSLYHYFRKFLSVLLVVSVITLPLSTSVSAAETYVPNYSGMDSFNNYLKYKNDTYKKYTNLSDFPTGYPYSNYDLMHQKLLKELEFNYTGDMPLIERFPDGFKPHYMYMFSNCRWRRNDNGESVYDVDDYNVIYTENQLVYDTTPYSTPWGTSDISIRLTGKFLRFKIQGNYLDKFFKKMKVSSTNDSAYENNFFDSSSDGTWFVHNGSSKILDKSGNPLDLNVDGYNEPSESKYRLQTTMERYTDYTIERYQSASPLGKYNNWFSRPDIAYDADNVNKLGGKRDYDGFYFKPYRSDSNPVAAAANLLGSKYYTYHLYYWNGTGWGKRSVWTDTLLQFTPATLTEGVYKPPELRYQQNTFAIVVDYRADGNHYMNAIRQAAKGTPVFNKDTQYAHFYIVSDDMKTASDKNNGNHGSLIVDPNGTVTDDGGEVQDSSNEWDGSISVPTKPGVDTGVVGWFQWFFDSVNAVVQTIGTGFNNIVSSCGDFFAFLGSAFSFLPAQFWVIILAGVSVLIVLRILGR